MKAISLIKSRMDSLLASHDGSARTAILRLYQRAMASDFVQKILETLATRILVIGIGVVTGVLIARILGPEGRGLFAVAATISAIGVQFGNLGLHSANTYAVSRDRNLLPELLGNSLVVCFLLGGVGALATWLVFSLRPEIFPLPGLLLALVLASIPLSLAYLLCQNLLLGIQEVRTFNKIELSSRILAVGLITLVIVIGAVTPATVFLAGLVAAVANLIWVLWRLGPFMPRLPRPSWGLLQENITYGLKAYLACFFGFLVIRFDLLMVQYMLGSEQTGYYSIAVSMADMLYLLPTAIGAILFPKLSAMATREEKWRLTLRTALVVGVLMTVLGAGAMLIAHPTVRLIFTAEFLPCVPAFLILAAAMVFLGLNTIFSNYLASMGLPWFVVHVWVAVTLLNVGLNFLLIPSYGILGAAVSSLICYLTALVVLLFYAARYRPDSQQTPS